MSEFSKPTVTPRVTAIVSTYNRARYLKEALESLLAQTRAPDELIIIDDASSDATAEILAPYRYRPGVKVVVNAENRGKPANLNTWIPKAEGEYVWLFDDDDVALADALARHLSVLADDPGIDFTYSGCFGSADADIWDRSRWEGGKSPDFAPEALLIETMRAMYTLMQGMLLPRDILIRIGLFNPELDRCEDHEMLLRLAANYRGRGLAAPTYVFRVHSGIRGSTGKQHLAADRERVMIEYRRLIFQKVRDTFELRHFIQHRDARFMAANATLSAADTAAALLVRGMVMMRQGVAAEGWDDFEAALAHEGFGAVDSDWVANVVADAGSPEPWIYSSPLATLRRVYRSLYGTRHPKLIFEFARGNYWAFWRELENRNIGRATSTLMTCGGVLSMGVMQVIASKCE